MYIYGKKKTRKNLLKAPERNTKKAKTSVSPAISVLFGLVKGPEPPKELKKRKFIFMSQNYKLHVVFSVFPAPKRCRLNLLAVSSPTTVHNCNVRPMPSKQGISRAVVGGGN